MTQLSAGETLCLARRLAPSQSMTNVVPTMTVLDPSPFIFKILPAQGAVDRTF